MRQGLSGIEVARHPLVVVYEPTWAIGAGRASLDAARFLRVIDQVAGAM